MRSSDAAPAVTRQIRLASASSAPRRGSEYARAVPAGQAGRAAGAAPGHYVARSRSPSCCWPPDGPPSSCWVIRGGSWPWPRSWRSCSPSSGSWATTPGTGRSSAPGGPATAGHPAGQPGHRAELRLVGRQAQPAPRAPQHRGRGSRHRDRRAGLQRRPGAGRPGPGPAGVPLPGLPVLPDAARRGDQPARLEHPRAGQPDAGRRPAEAALLAAHAAGYLTIVFLVLSPVKAVVFILVQQGLFGLYLGMLVRPQPQGHAHPGRRRPAATSCAARCSPPATSAAAG